MSTSASRLYLWHVGLAVIALGLVSTAAVSMLLGTSASVPSATAISGACRDWLTSQGLGSLIGLALAALVLAGVFRGLGSIAEQLAGTRCYLRRWPNPEQRLVAGTECRVIHSADAHAFCAGYLRPRIYLSRGAIAELNQAELRAVLAHEEYHRSRRDPLRRLIARSLAKALFFVPVLGGSSERYLALGELAADEAALRTVGDRQPLAAALVKFGKRGAGPDPVVALASERVDHLLGEPGLARWRLSASLLTASAAALFGLGLLVLLQSYGAISPTIEPAVLIGTSCMLGMVAAPAFAAGAALVLSWRAWRERRSPAQTG